MLQSLSSKMEELNVDEKKRDNALETMQNTLHRERNRFNQSLEIILETSDFLRIDQLKN